MVGELEIDQESTSESGCANQSEDLDSTSSSGHQHDRNDFPNKLDTLSDTSESAPASTSEDVDSTCSSRSSSIVSYDYEYDPNHFPKLNEIEEFQSPSFSWPASPFVSGRLNSARSAPIQYNQNWPKKLATKLQAEANHLSLLLALAEVTWAADFENPTKFEVIAEAQKILDKTSSNAHKDWDQTVEELETAITNISCLLPRMKVTLTKQIQKANLISKTAREVGVGHRWYNELRNLKSKSEQLTRLLWLVACNDFYERPLPCIVARIEETLLRGVVVAKKYRNSGNIASLVFINSTTSLVDSSKEINNCIMDVSWLIRICKSSPPYLADHEDVDGYIGKPPFAVDEPILYSIWAGIATLLNSSVEGKVEAAVSLASLAGDYEKLIIMEGGVEPLLKLAKEGGAVEQEKAIKTLGFLCRTKHNAMKLAGDGSKVCSVMVSILNGGQSSIQVQANASLAISQLADHYIPGSCFNHLTLIVEPLLKYLIGFANRDDAIQFVVPNVTRALCMLVTKDPDITMWRAFDSNIFFQLLLDVPVLIGKGTPGVQYNTAKLLLKIARKCRRDIAFMIFFFDEMNMAARSRNSPLNDLVELVKEEGHNDPLVCWTTEVIRSLVGLLSSRQKDIVLEAFIALTKFNYEYCTLHKINHGIDRNFIANPITFETLKLVDGMCSDSPEGCYFAVDSAAKWLMCLADHSDKYGKSIIEQGGVEPLLKLTMIDQPNARQSAIRALGFLGRDLDNAKMVARDGTVYSVLADVLRGGTFQEMADAAWAVSQLAAHCSCIVDTVYRDLEKIDNAIAYTILIDQLLVIVNWEPVKMYMSASECRSYHKIVLFCIEALGSLSLICLTTKVIWPLVGLLDREEDDVVLKAVLALTEFTKEFPSPYKTTNHMYIQYCEVIANSGSRYISQLIYQRHTAQKPAVLLALSVAAQVRHNEELNNTIAWAYKQSHLRQDATITTAIADTLPGAESHFVPGTRNSARWEPIQFNQDWPKKLATKLQAEADHLSILLALAEVAWEADFENPSKFQVTAEAQKILDKAYSDVQKDWDQTVEELEMAVTNISCLLPRMKVALTKQIQQANLIAKTVREVGVKHRSYNELQNLKSKSEQLTKLLRLVACSDFYDRPLPCIVARIEETLSREVVVAKKYHNSGKIASLLFINSTTSLVNSSKEINNCIKDVSWLIRICMLSSPCLSDHQDVIDDYIGSPPFAVAEPIGYSIWEGIATLLKSSAEGKVEAAESLVSLAGDNDEYGKKIITEGGEEPLLKLAKEGGADAQERAIRTLGFLCRNMDNAMMLAGDGSMVCSVMVSILNGGQSSIQVQANASLAISQLAAHYIPGSCFNHLTLIVEPLLKYLIGFVNRDDAIDFVVPNVTRALCMLVTKDPDIIIWRAFESNIFSRLLLRVPVLIGKGTQEVQYNTAKFLLEIARKCRRDTAFMMFFFDEMNIAARSWKSPLVEIFKEAGYNEPLVCWTTEVIRSLVGLLKSQQEDMVLEAFIALTKFTYEYCSLHKINPGKDRNFIANPITYETLKLVARMCNKPDDAVAAAVEWLECLASCSDQYAKNIIKHGGVEPLLKLAEKGQANVRQSANRVLEFIRPDFDYVDGSFQPRSPIDY